MADSVFDDAAFDTGSGSFLDRDDPFSVSQNRTVDDFAREGTDLDDVDFRVRDDRPDDFRQDVTAPPGGGDFINIPSDNQALAGDSFLRDSIAGSTGIESVLADVYNSDLQDMTTGTEGMSDDLINAVSATMASHNAELEERDKDYLKKRPEDFNAKDRIDFENDQMARQWSLNPARWGETQMKLLDAVMQFVQWRENIRFQKRQAKLQEMVAKTQLDQNQQKIDIQDYIAKQRFADSGSSSGAPAPGTAVQGSSAGIRGGR